MKRKIRIQGAARSRGTLVAPSRFAAPLTITRAQAAGVLSSSVNSTDSDLVFYGADVPRFNGSAQRLLIGGQRTNLINGMAAPVTQNITVTAVAHTLTFYGTGSITLSGVATGTLNGTGANNRVSLTFTPTAGTLTLTVSGSVTRAQLEVGAFASSYIEVSSGAATRGIDVVGAPLTDLGITGNGACTILWSGVLPLLIGTTGVDHRIFQIDDNTASNVYRVYHFSGSNLSGQRITGGATIGGTIGTITANTAFRVGMSVDGAGRVAFSLNGNAPLIVTGGPTSGMTNFRLGTNHNATFTMWGETSRLRVLPYSVSDVELQSMVEALP